MDLGPSPSRTSCRVGAGVPERSRTARGRPGATGSQSVWRRLPSPHSDSARCSLNLVRRPPVHLDDRTSRKDLRRPVPLSQSDPPWKRRTASFQGRSSGSSGSLEQCSNERAFRIRVRTRGRNTRKLACLAPSLPSILNQSDGHPTTACDLSASWPRHDLIRPHPGERRFGATPPIRWSG